MSLSSLLTPLSTLAHAGHSHSSVDTAVTVSVFAAFFLFLLALYAVFSYMLARIFKKAGVDGWKAWVPVYSTWVTLELGDQKGWWAILMLLPIINIVASVFLYLAMYTIGLRLGKEGYFVLLAIFLPIAWYAVLAFDQSTWKKPTTTPAYVPPTPPAA